MAMTSASTLSIPPLEILLRKSLGPLTTFTRKRT
jgi:hypothetical protein